MFGLSRDRRPQQCWDLFLQFGDIGRVILGFIPGLLHHQFGYRLAVVKDIPPFGRAVDFINLSILVVPINTATANLPTTPNVTQMCALPIWRWKVMIPYTSTFVLEAPRISCVSHCQILFNQVLVKDIGFYEIRTRASLRNKTKWAHKRGFWTKWDRDLVITFLRSKSLPVSGDTRMFRFGSPGLLGVLWFKFSVVT